MTETAWAAGLFEGEGCVSVGRHGTGAFTTEAGRATVNVTLSTTDLDVLEHFMAVVGCGFISERKRYAEMGYKRQWRWACRNLPENEHVIRILYPYMGQRRRARMDEALDVLEAKRERRRKQGIENFKSSPHDEMVRDETTGRFVGRVAA